MTSRESEIQQVATKLNGLLGELEDAVAGLRDILDGTAAQDGEEVPAP